MSDNNKDKNNNVPDSDYGNRLFDEMLGKSSAKVEGDGRGAAAAMGEAVAEGKGVAKEEVKYEGDGDDFEWMDEERLRRQKEHSESIWRERYRQRAIRRFGIVVIVLVVSIAALAVVAGFVIHGKNHKVEVAVEETESTETETQEESEAEPEPIVPSVFEAHETDSTGEFPETVESEYGLLIDVESGEIVAAKDAYARINPASMTKLLTVLVAAENITEEQLDDTFEMTIEITDYCYVNDCSAVGFSVGEEIPVRDLFYGTVLPSGADAAAALATYVAGSQEAFVDMMNEKLEEMGLSETTHFTNCVGLYDEDHYSTCYDIAVILKAATDNEWCREVLSQHSYTTTPTAEHPDGITISNWFLRRIEDYDTHGEVLCAKTGFVNQSGSCAASLATDGYGREYICVTVGASSSWQCIYDQIDIYAAHLETDADEED